MAKASQSKPECYGVAVMKAPGGGLVVVAGPIDLTRAEALSPAWTREIRETRPTNVTSEPDNSGHTTTKLLPMLTKVGSQRVHGESVLLAARRLNRESGKLLNAALLGSDVAPLELLESMRRDAKPVKPRIQETKRDKRLRAERAMDLLGKPDVVVARVLKAAGRTEAQIAAYLKERAA
jgi:hypothetical protein